MLVHLLHLLYHSSKKVKELGRVAEFCPVCREVTAFNITRTRRVRSTFFIQLGEGTLLALVGKCGGCKFMMAVTLTDYGQPAAIVKSKGAYAVTPIEELIATTHPRIKQARAWQLDQTVRLESEGLEGEERTLMIRHALELTECYFKEKSRDISGIALAGALLFIVGVITLLNAAAANANITDEAPTFVAGLVITYFGAKIFRGRTRRFVRSTLGIYLTRLLEPLHPTHEELSQALAEMRAAKMLAGRKLKAEWVLPIVEEVLAKWSAAAPVDKRG
jgi:hypothetical protein